MTLPDYATICLPAAPASITKGQPLKEVLNETAIGYLARNVALVYDDFDVERFYHLSTTALDELSLMQRAQHIAQALFETLPANYEAAIQILIDSMVPARTDTERTGLAVFGYLPYSCFIAQYGVSDRFNEGRDPFDTSMRAQYELTQRFTAEFSIRPFLIAQQDRTLAVLASWLTDPSDHVRRLCSEGVRPKLPWGINLPALIKDPTPILPTLEALKNDASLYVRRSVANNLGDIAKNHPELVFHLCEQWLEHADSNLRWVIRHAVRYYAKKNHPQALRLRLLAK